LIDAGSQSGKKEFPVFLNLCIFFQSGFLRPGASPGRMNGQDFFIKLCTVKKVDLANVFKTYFWGFPMTEPVVLITIVPFIVGWSMQMIE
jgi:hypothetical protein